MSKTTFLDANYESHYGHARVIEMALGHAKTRPTKQLDWLGLGISPRVVKVRVRGLVRG